MEEYITSFINNSNGETVPEKVRGIVSCWSCYYKAMIQPELGIEKVHVSTSNYNIRKNFIEITIRYYGTPFLKIAVPIERKRRTRRVISATLLYPTLTSNFPTFVIGGGEEFIDYLEKYKTDILYFFKNPPQPLI